MIRVLELFGGIGAFTQAMKRLNLPIEVVDYVEIDKYAVASYNAMNGTQFECQDIREYSRGGRHDVDIIMHGSPCQDFSLAGKGKGGDEGSGTRSSLMYETIRIVSEEMPKVVIWENVKALLSAKHRHNFDAYLERLEELGYKNYYRVLNAKDYGIPQNRERIFTVSILGDHKPFVFPSGFQLITRLIDLLDKENVPESFYISEEKLGKLLTRDFYKKHPAICKDGTVSAICSRDYKDPKCIQVGNLREGTELMPNPSSGRVYDPEGLSPTILSRDYKEPKLIQVGNLYGTEVEPNPCAGRVWDPDGLSPTVQTCQGGNRMPLILETDKLEIKEATKKGYDLAEGGDTVNLEQPNSKTRRGRVGHGVAQTLTTACNQAVVEPVVDMKCLRPVRTEYGKEIRKQYEAHEIDSKWSDMRKLEPREDNTLTHVQKDNYIAITEPFIAAERGRNPEKPSDRTAGVHTEQRLEPNTQGLCNTLTSVQKDNLVVEPINVSSDGTARTINNHYSKESATNIMGQVGYGATGVQCGLRVRKLTPRECWRLMGFSDEVFEKAEKVNSNTQLYKQAGNSIVVNVLVEIIKKLMESVDFGMPENKKPVKVKVRKVKK